MLAERIITKYIGSEDGPMLIVFGGMHGNEPAGIEAIQKMGQMLKAEPLTNPDFKYKGSFLGLIGNRRAYAKGQRFINVDLNRSWTRENIDIIHTREFQDLTEEQKEIKEILDVIDEQITEMNPSKVIVLDLHTTSSFGGIFSITTDDPESVSIAVELHAPVIKGMLKGIRGTTLHFFNSSYFGVDMIPVTFESGQHLDKLSVKRAIAAITNCMRTIGSVSADHVENQHDSLLLEYSKDLPKVARLLSKHTIENGDNFIMKPDYKNFQMVTKGELLATDINGAILAPEDSLLLMPLYQSQGEDGFFLIKEVEF